MIYKSVSDARAHLPELVDTTSRVVLTRNGQPVAVLLSIGEFRSLQATLALASQPGFLQQILQADAEPISDSVRATPAALDELVKKEATGKKPKARVHRGAFARTELRRKVK